VAFNILLAQHGMSIAIDHVGIATPVIILFYGVAVYTVFQYEKSTLREHAGDIAERYPNIALPRALILYGLAASVVILVALRLPATAEHMGRRSWAGTERSWVPCSSPWPLPCRSWP
jgi:hypothetical protein